MDNLQQAIDESRKLAHELAVPDFSIASLKDRMIVLTAVMLKSSGLDAHLNINPFDERLLSTPQLLAIYRIVQRAIHKHCKSTQRQTW